jgi:hypothetical protein
MLTNEQVEALFAFCRKHDVQYYDVQVELVDHLANAIEDKMAAQPAMGFEEALKQVYKSFGKAGFVPLVNEKQKAAKQYNRKLLRRLLREQLGWPKVFIGLTIFAALYIMLQWEDKTPVRVFTIGSIVASTIVMEAMLIHLLYWQKKTGRKFMLVNLGNVANLGIMPLNCYNIISPFLNRSLNWLEDISVTYSLLCCAFYTFYIIIAIVFCQAAWHVRSVLKKSYPDAFANA